MDYASRVKGLIFIIFMKISITNKGKNIKIYLKNINIILLLYIIFPIIDELIIFINLLKSIIGERIDIIVKNKYTITNPATIP